MKYVFTHLAPIVFYHLCEILSRALAFILTLDKAEKAIIASFRNATALRLNSGAGAATLPRNNFARTRSGRGEIFSPRGGRSGGIAATSWGERASDALISERLQERGSACLLLQQDEEISKPSQRSGGLQRRE